MKKPRPTVMFKGHSVLKASEENTLAFIHTGYNYKVNPNTGKMSLYKEEKIVKTIDIVDEHYEYAEWDENGRRIEVKTITE
jgi:uncharacterized lipoprotein YehR (DUF1307 family)